MTRRPDLRHAAASAAVATGLLLAACGGSGGSSGSATSTTTARRAPVGGDRARPAAAPKRGRAAGGEPSLATGRLLVYFKRVVGYDPLASQLTVDRDGTSAAIITLGGVAGEKKHEFRLDRASLGSLARLLRRTRLQDTTCCSPRSYIYWISHAGRTARLQQGHVPAADRRLIDELDALTDAHTTY